MSDNNEIKKEINEAIKELRKRGVDINSHKTQDVKGLGDVVEDALKSIGITEEKFKQWFNLKECNCSQRKKWLNGLFRWKINKK